jgi:hypothetical protein
VRHGLEKADDFVGAEHDGKAARLVRRGDQIVEAAGFFERDFIEKPQCTDRVLGYFSPASITMSESTSDTAAKIC